MLDKPPLKADKEGACLKERSKAFQLSATERLMQSNVPTLLEAED